jgi:hypothetical protein
MQMFLTAMLIDALHAALEDREVAFNRVRMDFTATILASRMVDEGV